MVGRFLIAASVAAMIGAAPAIAAKSQQPTYIPPSGQSGGQQGTMSGQQMPSGQTGSQAEQSKKIIQPNGETNGQATGNQAEQNQATGESGEKTKKIQQPSQQTGQQTGEQTTTGQNEKTKKLQQNTQQEQNVQPNKQGQQATGTTGEKTKKIQQGQPSGQTTTGATGRVATEIPPEKRTIVREKIVGTNVERIDRTRININLSVGAIVPNTIRLHRVPEEVVRILPAFSGFMFFVLDDATIILVEPGTLRIAFVLAA